ncbi:MAG TPA: nucleotidyltransferase family protein [Armatimonadota bacterium]|nr:nucleotidyltransferase family protein [Armatimonadota bacterium]
MGALKPLLPYGSGTVIRAAVRSLRASPVSRVLVVLGHRSEEIAADLQGSGAETVFNPRYREGMLTSVQAGVAAAPEDTEWLVIALGDQPWVRPETVALLLDEARNGGPGIVVPSYGGRRGHPLLLHSRYRGEIARLEGQGGLRELLRRHPEEIRYVLFPDESVLRDMDTPEEYQQALKDPALAPTPGGERVG